MATYTRLWLTLKQHHMQLGKLDAMEIHLFMETIVKHVIHAPKWVSFLFFQI